MEKEENIQEDTEDDQDDHHHKVLEMKANTVAEKVTETVKDAQVTKVVEVDAEDVQDVTSDHVNPETMRVHLKAEQKRVAIKMLNKNQYPPKLENIRLFHI